MRDQHAGAEPHVRTSGHTHHSPDAALPCSVPLPDPSRVGLDARQNPDLVSLQYSGSAERAGMAGPANEPGRIEVRAAGELFCLAGGLSAGAGADEPAVREELGGAVEQIRRAI